ncbi:DUF1957 domain-containing protein [candidate division GN15 bacterium]|nr:DUF1957 domain-containing protein [candidate division GN15 bacterium]
MTAGRFAFVLHGHLPYVLGHGRWPHGSDWLCEAASETYLPLIAAVERLAGEGYHPKLTFGLSPILCEQLADERFGEEFYRYLSEKQTAAHRDRDTFAAQGDEHFTGLAERWEQLYAETRDTFERLGGDIIGRFRQLQDHGYLEIITCGATHAYFPLLARDETVSAQTKLAVENYRKHFGRPPRGIWLPECGYRPAGPWSPPVMSGGLPERYHRKGIEEFLAENNLDFFVADTAVFHAYQATAGSAESSMNDLMRLQQGLLFSAEQHLQPAGDLPRHAYRVASRSESSRPVAVFVRDPETGYMVWSGEHGYPGDAHYLEFHKKRTPGGLRYWSVTEPRGDLADKQAYHPEPAAHRVHSHAADFVARVTGILTDYHARTAHPGLLVAPFDAELFGHWWHEGPAFIEQTLRRFCEHDAVELTFLSESLDTDPPQETVELAEGSWGLGNHHLVWLNDDTEWTWRYIYTAETSMQELVQAWERIETIRAGQAAELIAQAARELMLLAASDWQFLISNGAARDYAESRIDYHFTTFIRLAGMVAQVADELPLSEENERWLRQCQARDRVFAEIDPAMFLGVRR